MVLSKGSNNSEPKIIFLDFLSIFVNFFGVKNSKNLQTILTRKINFLIFFSRFLSFFGVFQKLAHYSFQTILKFGSLFGSNNVELKIIFLDFFSIFLSFFWCILKVSSLFASDNSEPKKIIDFFFLDFFVNFFSVILFGADNSEPKIIFDLFFENVMSISIFELEKYVGSIVGSVEDVDC